MKYAAKRTWPDKPKSWEAKGEAESAEAFALEFASEKGLGLGTEIVVIEREDDDGEILFYKVSNTSPYQFTSAAPRVGGAGPASLDAAAPAASAAESSPADVTVELPELPNLRPFRSMIFYMAKVAIIAVVVIGAFGFMRKIFF